MKRVLTIWPLLWPLSRRAAVAGDGVSGRVNRMAGPVIVENLLQTLMGVVDMILVGGLGADALAGVGSAIQVLWVIQSGFAAITTGTTVLIAHNTGAGKRDDANWVLKQSVMVATVLGILIGILGWYLAFPIIEAMGGEPEMVIDGAIYFRITATMSIFILGMFILGAALRGAGDSKTPMKVAVVANIINAVLAWAMINGHLGFPALGIIGSAWATAIARAVGMFLLLGVLIFGRGKLHLKLRGSWRPDWSVLRRMFNIGLPSMGEQLMMSVGMLLFGVVAIRMGTEVYAAQRVVMNMISFSFMPGLGYAIAATALAGQYLGAREPYTAKRSTDYATLAALVIMSAVAVVMFFWGEPLMRIYTSDEVIIAIGVTALKVLALTQPFQAIGQVLAGGLRGAGDTRYPMIITSASIWLIRLPLAFLFGPIMGLSLAWVFVAAVLDGAFRAVMMWARYRQNKWMHIKV
ncbi:MAG: MATE family efflux transporter [Anaerolineae bacterium]